jgi:hypothetical protein
MIGVSTISERLRYGLLVSTYTTISSNLRYDLFHNYITKCHKFQANLDPKSSNDQFDAR